MSLPEISRLIPSEITAKLRMAGTAGAGGAGFPSYPKWETPEDLQYMLVNHQESEPNFYGDKWQLKAHAEEYAAFFDSLLEEILDVIVVGAKAEDRAEWMWEFERAADATVYRPDALPIDVQEESGVVVGYTESEYQYGMESVLLQTVAGTIIGQDLPASYGWIVHNTETLYNIYRGLEHDAPVTRKYVHVDGPDLDHRLLEVPIGTPGTALIEAAGRDPAALDDDTIVHGGPGWCSELDEDIRSVYVRKHTNGLLVEDAAVVEENIRGNDRISLLSARDWAEGDHETEPETLEPDRVRVPCITNPDHGDVVERSEPTVSVGERVAEGDVLAAPSDNAISIAQHASIDGTVTDVTDSSIEIRRS